MSDKIRTGPFLGRCNQLVSSMLDYRLRITAAAVIVLVGLLSSCNDVKVQASPAPTANNPPPVTPPPPPPPPPPPTAAAPTAAASTATAHRERGSDEPYVWLAARRYYVHGAGRYGVQWWHGTGEL